VHIVRVGVAVAATVVVAATQLVSPTPARAEPKGFLDVGLVAVGPANNEQSLVARVRLGCFSKDYGVDADVLVRTRAGRVRVTRKVRAADDEADVAATVRLEGRASADPAVYAGTIQANIVEYENDLGHEVVSRRCERRGDWSARVTSSTATGRVIRGGPVHAFAAVDVAGSSATVDVLSGIEDRQPVVAHAELDAERFRWTIDAPELADGVGAGERSVWVVSGGDTITRLRGDDGEKVLDRTIPDSYDCCEVLSPPIAVTPDAVFVPGGDFPEIVRFDARTGSPQSLDLEVLDLEVGKDDFVVDVATQGDDLYAAVELDAGGFMLLRVDAHTGATLASRSLGDEFYDVQLRSDGTTLWGAFTVQDDEMMVVERLDPATLAAVARVVLPEWSEIAVAEPGFWLAHTCYPDEIVCDPAGDLAGGEAVAYDATTLAPTMTVPLRGDLTAAGGHAWLFNSNLGALIELG
jgi:hypothetical protein